MNNDKELLKMTSKNTIEKSDEVFRHYFFHTFSYRTLIPVILIDDPEENTD